MPSTVLGLTCAVTAPLHAGNWGTDKQPWGPEPGGKHAGNLPHVAPRPRSDASGSSAEPGDVNAEPQTKVILEQFQFW